MKKNILRQMGELSTAINGYGEVDQNSADYKKVEEMKKQLGGLRRTFWIRIGIIVGIKFASGSVALYLHQNRQEDTKSPAVASAVSRENSPTPSTAETSENRENPLKLELQERTAEFIKKYGSKADADGAVDYMRKNMYGKNNYNRYVNWHADLYNPVRNEKRDPRLRAVEFFRNNGIPMVEEAFPKMKSFLGPGQFFVNELGQRDDSEITNKVDRENWCRENILAFYDPENSTLHLPDPKRWESSFPLGQNEAAMMTVAEASYYKGHLVPGEFGDTGKAVLKSLLGDNALRMEIELEIRAKQGGTEKEMASVLYYFAGTLTANISDNTEGMKLRTRLMYVLAKATAASVEYQLDTARPFLKKIAESPQEYLDPANFSNRDVK